MSSQMLFKRSKISPFSSFSFLYPSIKHRCNRITFPSSFQDFKIALIILLLILLGYYFLLQSILSSKTKQNASADMSSPRYITIDGRPPCGGIPSGVTFIPRAGAPNPMSSNGGFMGSGVIGVIMPRPDVGHDPNWQPWQNVPGLPTASTTTTTNTPAAPRPAITAPTPSGSNVPTTDKPLRLPSGMGYVFPKSHATIHVIEPGYLPYEKPRGTFQWRVYKVPTIMSVAEFIEQICELSHEQKQKKKTMKDVVSKRVVECVELGGGIWGRASEYCIGEGKGKDAAMKKAVELNLAKISWDESRGTTSPPIWVATQVVTK